METEQQRILRKEKRKKLLLIFFVIITGIFVILGVLTLVLSGINSWLRERSIENFEEQNLKSQSYIFETPNYDENIFDDSIYMTMDREVHYKFAEVTTGVNDDNYASQTESVRFMYDIINYIINGDYEKYNEIFIDSYVESAEKKGELRETFTMQKLHNIEMELVNTWETAVQDGKKVVYADFKVSYMIKNNNGTFRNDLPEETYRPVVYRIMTEVDTRNETSESSVYNLLLYVQYTSGLYE